MFGAQNFDSRNLAGRRCNNLSVTLFRTLRFGVPIGHAQLSTERTAGQRIFGRCVYGRAS
jgi:hypothetical protein